MLFKNQGFYQYQNLIIFFLENIYVTNNYLLILISIKCEYCSQFYYFEFYCFKNKEVLYEQIYKINTNTICIGVFRTCSKIATLDG